MTRWIDADAVAGELKPGMTVFVAGATAEPREILEALARQGKQCAGVRFVSIPIPGLNRFDYAAFHPEVRSMAFFSTAENRDSIAAGRVDFVPLQYRAIFDYLEHDLEIDAAILQLPPAGDDGMVGLGVTTDFAPAVFDKARLVIGEINSRQPAPRDAPKIPFDRLDFAVACERPVPTLPASRINDAVRAIGRHAADMIRDGDCIQIGIGTIPGATLDALAERNDLGIHSGMIADGVMELANAGNITGRAKSVDTGTIVTGVALGCEALLEWSATAPNLAFRPVNYTHDVGVIRQLDNFVSINSALEVDLFGQVNAEMLNGRQTSATGGLVDMMRGAALSKGGRSIIALASTAGGSTVSRIVGALSSRNAVTASRTDIDFVVTEHGARRIRHLSVEARAEALIEIAAPEFRDALRDDWRARGRPPAQ